MHNRKSRNLPFWLLLICIFIGLSGFAQAQDVEYIVPYEQQTNKGGWYIANTVEPFPLSGCYVTSAWMVRHAAGKYSGNLDSFNQWLKANKACDPTAGVTRGTLTPSGTTLLEIKSVGSSQSKLDEILKSRPVIIKTDYHTSSHFYVVIGKKGNNYLCNDPVTNWKDKTGGEKQLRSFSQLCLKDIRDIPTIGTSVAKVGSPNPAVAASNNPVPAGSYAIRTSNNHYLTAENGGGVNGQNAIKTDRTIPYGWEQFTFVPLSGGYYAIRAYNGRYLTAMNAGGVDGPDAIRTNATKVDSWEKFTLEPQPGGSYAIRTYNGRYLTAMNAGGVNGPDAIRTNATKIDSWERFNLEVVFTSELKNCSIRTSNNHYLTAENGGGMNGPNAIHTDRTVVNSWEKFTFVPQSGGGTCAIRTLNGRYLTAENGGGVNGPNAIHTDRTVVNSWERFTLEPQPGGSYAIRAYNGRYLTAMNAGGVNGPDAIRTNATKVDSWERFTLQTWASY